MTQHPGKKVYGKGKHRDAVRSSHSYTAFRWGVSVRWVYVKDLSGTHREEYFFTTAQNRVATEVINYYTGRWSIETTFQESRSYLGVDTTRGWSEKTILRREPMLFLLYSIITLIYMELPEKYKNIKFSELTVS